MEILGEMFVVPFFGQGHLFPCMELCKHISSSNFQAILIIPIRLSSSIPSSLRRHSSLIEVVEIHESQASPPTHSSQPEKIGSEPRFRPDPPEKRLGSGLEAFLSERYKDPNHKARPVCAVIDVMMGGTREFFQKFGIRTVSFLTSSASSVAVRYATWKDHPAKTEMKPGDYLKLPGLPEEMMEVSHSDLKMEQRHRMLHPHDPNPTGQPGDRPGLSGGPPSGGVMRFGPPWLNELNNTTALLFNTSDGLEHPFLIYLADRIGKPVYGVGPFLPEQYWRPTGLILRDGEVRPNRESNCTEEQVIQWLDSKPAQSVIYISFGSEVGPSMEGYGDLADALEELDRPFIWAIQPNAGQPGHPPGLLGEEDSGSEPRGEAYYPHGLQEKVGNRGMIIRGWAPQLLILSHPATGGFVSHCGWNSTMEAAGRGVPILAWPIRGDQFINAKLVVKYLKAGRFIFRRDDPAEMVKKEDIVEGIETLLDDEEVYRGAMELSRNFRNGFPSCSIAALKSFLEAMKKKD